MAELQFAAFIAQTVINFTQGEKVLKLFKMVSQDRVVLQGTHMSHVKISNVKNVISPYQEERNIKSLQNCKFNLFLESLQDHSYKLVKHYPTPSSELYCAGLVLLRT